ncbi:RDD family protein [Dokdonia sp. MED134]|uniref:RDD family protein n=1 Tax=Dokdonia sp. MED134 TaxID=313590 RepID=UPI0000689C3A|nr:RDD family protein [Dokdonia sp. MED134]EAQ38292.1 RDD family protein [Dokdonia sp. MED134]
MKITNEIYRNLDLASEDDRSENFRIDFLISSTLGIFISILTYENLIFGILTFYIVRFMYYFSLEMILGQTISKLQTQTKVVNKKGEKPSVLNLFIRNVSRFWSLLSGITDYERAIHDKLSNTFVIKNKSLRKFKINKIIRLTYDLIIIGIVIYSFITRNNRAIIDFFMVAIFLILLFDIIRLLIKN